MDQRRAAGALLALVVCIASTAAAPTVSNQTGLDLYDGSAEGCYYNFQHYGEGDRIMTNEPCLNCTCHNRMLMCYLRVCPFTKPIGQDCTVEKRADQCCPIVTCPDVPVDLLTSTSTTSPAEYGATGLGKLDKYGCSIHGKYFPEGSKVPPTPNKPCEHCYCIRNMTTCVMQECTLHVDGCTPIYHKDVCCPVRYSCDHPEDSTLLLDDMTTTVRPTPGFLLTTTTLSPVTQMSQDCVHDDQIFADGALIKTEKACEHCYCMKGDIVCVVQECGTPMENEGKNCTSEPPREGQCCPDTYICEGDELTTEPPSEFTTQSLLEELTTLSPPRRVGVEGSGYRNEPDEAAYTEAPLMETESEGSGYEQSTEPAAVDGGSLLTSETPEISSEPINESLYPGRTTVRTPTLEEVEKTTEPDKGLNTVPSDEDMYKPSITEKTPLEDPNVTETILTSDEKPDLSEEKTTIPEDIFMPVATTKPEESSSTTESAFRKEDALGEHTEIYNLGEPEKVSTQATDIEKETEVTSSKTKAPFIEELEKQTTLLPEFTQKDFEQGLPSKESTTEPLLEITTSADVKLTDKITTDFVELGQTETTKPAMDKEIVTEITSLDQNEIEDVSTTLPPGRIPGEGDCLLNDITYRNNSIVPNSNNCHTGCRCVSSIIKCDPIICSPPPEYMDNCQPTYDSPDACCPTYVCHTGETMPPQPHSQMSGTDNPLLTSPIECHGNECEVKKDDSVPIVGDCGSAGCDEGHSGIPETSPEDCKYGKCSLPVQPCVDGNCQETQTTHCENGKCGIEPEIITDKDKPLCENESDCKESIPDVPQPHSQTDNPLLPSPIECHGDECEVRKDDNVPVVGDCGSAGCDEEHSGIPETSPEDCHDGKCSLPVQPCVDGSCQEIPGHCENGKCGIEPEIVPVKDKPLCENESDCKETVPEISSCEGEGCIGVNIDCSGTDCSTDFNKLPAIPGKDKESCEGDCKTPEDETIQPCTESSCKRKETGQVGTSLPSDCSGSECIQQIPSKEDNLNKLTTTLPVTEDLGIKSTQQFEMTTVTHEIKTELPESQTKASDDVSEHQPTAMVELGLEESSTGSPIPQATEVPEHSEDKYSGTESSSQLEHTTESQLDKEDTKTPQAFEDLSTLKPQISVTEETRISETDAITKEPQETTTTLKERVDIQSPVTESQDVTKDESEESHESETTQHTMHSESTEGPYYTELNDIRTAEPLGSVTSSPEKEGTKTKLPEHHEELSTKMPEQEPTESLLPHEQDQADVNKATEDSVLYTPQIDIASTNLPETDVKQEVTESHEINVSSHDVTESIEIVDKSTESVETDEHKITTEMIQQEFTTARATLVTGSQEPEIGASYATSSDFESPFTNLPTKSHLDDVTESVTKKILEASTAKASEDTSYVTSETPEIYKTDKQEPFTESLLEYITESVDLSTKQPALPGLEPLPTESPEFTTDETVGEPELHVSEEDSKAQTLATLETDTKEKVTTQPSMTNIIEEGTTQASVVEEKTTISEPAKKPVVDDFKEQPTVSPDTNEVTPDTTQKLSEKPATSSTLQEDQHDVEQDSKVPTSEKTVTESLSTPVTEQPSKILIDDFKTDAPEKQITEAAQDITEQQEVGTEEPSISLVTDRIPSEPYIPVHPETTSDLTTSPPDNVNEIPDGEQDTQTPPSNENVEIKTEYPDRSGLSEATEVPEHMDTESPEAKPETATEMAATQPPEVYSEAPEVQEIHKDEQSLLPEKPTTEVPEDFVTKEKLETKGPESFTTEIPTVDEVPENTASPGILEQQEKESATTERIKEQPYEGEQKQTAVPEKYSTMYLIQETTVPSVTQPDSSEQPNETKVTESDTPYATSAPESHVKETQKPVTEIAEIFTTESHDMGVSVMQENLSTDKAVTEGTSEEKPIGETPDVHHDKPEENPELPKDTYTKTPDETSTVLLEVATESIQEMSPIEPTQEVKTPDEKATETSEKEEPSVSLSSDLPTGSSIGLDTVVTEPTQYKITESHEDEITTSISSDDQEKFTEHGSQETTTTVLQEVPQQPQESSTKIPQDMTSLPSDLELPEKYTADVSQEATSAAIPDVVTDAPEKQQSGSPYEVSTGKPLGVEDVEMPLTTLKTPETVDTETAAEQVTDKHEQSSEQPIIYETQKPNVADKEIMTDGPLTPTVESTEDEQTTPDMVELEEHSYKPVDDISTIAPTEDKTIPSLSEGQDEEKQKPQLTTEIPTAVPETEEEKVSSDELSPEISVVTTIDIGELPHMSTPAPSSAEDEQELDVPTTSQPGIEAGDQRFGDDTSQEEYQPTQASPESEQSPLSENEIPVQTEKEPTKTETELSHEITMLEEMSPVTTKVATEKEEEETLTQKPEYGDKEKSPEEKPQEEKVEKPLEKPTETPLIEPNEKPNVGTEQKPLEEIETSEKPTEEPVTKPLEEMDEKPTKTSLPEPTMTPVASEKPLLENDDKLVKPLGQAEEKPTETPDQKPQEEAEEKSTETPAQIPFEEVTTETPQDKPLIETGDMPTDTPLVESDKRPEDKPEKKPSKETGEKPAQQPSETPLEGSDEKLAEKPEQKPLDELENEFTESPEEKPIKETEEIPEEKPEQVPEEKPQTVFAEKPQDGLEDKPQETSEQKPLDTPEEKPLEVPEETPQEVPEGKPQEVLVPTYTTEVPTEKPQEGTEEKPQEEPVPTDTTEVPTEKPQEVPEEKPQEVLEEKPQDVPVPTDTTEVPAEKPQDVPVPTDTTEVPAEKPQEVPEEKPQEVPIQTDTTEVPAEKPQEVPEEEPQEVPVPTDTTEVPAEKPQEVPEEEPLEIPVTIDTTEVPADKPQEVPVPTDTTEVPAEKPQEVPEEKPQEIPVPTDTTEVPAEKPQEVPEEEPQEIPVSTDTTEVPAEKPQEVPEEEPQEIPVSTDTTEVPAEKPQEVPEEKPQEIPVPTDTTEVPAEKPQEVPEEKPQEVLVPTDKPEVPAEKPQEVPEEKLEVPTEKPQEVPKEKPEEMPLAEEKPQEVPEEKPAEPASTASPEISKPGFSDMQPTDEVPDDDTQFPPSGGTSGYGTEPDYVEEDQAFGPGTCRYGGKVYVSAQQIPRDDPCDFCFCFRSDIICLQQSCPPPIHGCHEEPIQGFCCPRYECPVAMATTLNVTTTTTTTTTTLPPHFLPHAYKGAAQRRGCQIKGHTYKVGEVVRASSGPCLHCTCGGDGQMKCDPKACTPEPMLRQMIAAAVSAKRRR